MSQKTTTQCDNCKAEAEDPKAEGWAKVNLHPWDVVPVSIGDDPDKNPPAEWLIRDICPECAKKIVQWLTGGMIAVFRKPRNG